MEEQRGARVRSADAQSAGLPMVRPKGAGELGQLEGGGVGIAPGREPERQSDDPPDVVARGSNACAATRVSEHRVVDHPHASGALAVVGKDKPIERSTVERASGKFGARLAFSSVQGAVV